MNRTWKIILFLIASTVLGIDDNFKSISPQQFSMLNRLVFWHYAPRIVALGFTPILREQTERRDGNVFYKNFVEQNFFDRRILTIQITPEISLNTGGMTLEAHLITLCHEVGHILGDEPKFKNNKLKLWSSFEPAADDWAMRNCIMEVLKRFPTQESLALFPRQSVEKCEEVYHNEKDVLRCARAMRGIAFHAKYFNEHAPTTQFCSMDSYDPTIAERTKNNVSNQCRIDIMRDALLKKPRKECWYKENKNTAKTMSAPILRY